MSCTDGVLSDTVYCISGNLEIAGSMLLACLFPLLLARLLSSLWLSLLVLLVLVARQALDIQLALTDNKRSGAVASVLGS